ncbi:MAG: M20 family metallopeptidase [Firmicutes bacterium]|nr:M20 family metallopeptidase [Bacillota bacterium]
MFRHYKDRLLHEIELHRAEFIEISQAIHAHPELGHREFFACNLLCQCLVRYGFKIRRNLAGLPTAFAAELTGRGPGPTIALLAEYDALPDLGHGCGHNLIATASVGAAAALSKVMPELNGKLVVLGTPAEETNGGKVTLVQAGEFASIDAALMFHPGDSNTVEITSLAMDALEFVYHGRASHAAACPYEGINALDGVIHLFNGVNALRQYVREEVRIHGIITEGGVAPNIIPERAAARFYVRAANRQYLNEVVEKMKERAQGAAIMSGTKLTCHNFELSYDNMITNQTLAQLFKQNLRALGVKDITGPREGKGSLDMGNVSHVVPAIHPYLSMNVPGLVPHSREFAEAAGGPPGEQVLFLAIPALAWTVLDLLMQPQIIRKAKLELERVKQEGADPGLPA